MKRSNERNVDYEKFIEIFNSQGKDAAKEFLDENYSLKYDYAVRFLKKETNYRFNRNTRKYYLVTQEDMQFLSIDKLLEHKNEEAANIVASIPEKVYYKDPIVSLTLDLYQDRLAELSKFITISLSSKTVEINLISLREIGYDINVINQ